MKSSELKLITVTMTAVFKPLNYEYTVSQTTENDWLIIFNHMHITHIIIESSRAILGKFRGNTQKAE